MSIQFKFDGADRNPTAEHLDPDPAGDETASPRPSEPATDHEVAAGCAWLAAWAATWLFAARAGLLAIVIVSGEGGPYGVTALAALAGAVALLAPAIAGLQGWVVLPGEARPVPVAGMTMLALAALSLAFCLR